MRIPALAIAWETQRRARRRMLFMFFVITILVFVASGGTAIRVLEPSERLSLVKGAYFVALWCQALAYGLALVLLQSAGWPSGRFLRLPSRTFTLPLQTYSLVGWHFVFGAMAIGLCSAAISSVVSLVFGVKLPILSHVLFVVGVYAACLAIAWIPAWLPIRLLCGYLVLQLLAEWLSFHYGAMWQGFGLAEYLTLIGWILAAYVIAILGVSMDRSGRCLGFPTRWKRFARIPFVQHRARPRAGTISKAFLSPGHAQLWFELRTKCWILPAVLGLALLFELILDAFGVIEDDEGVYFFLVTWCYLLPFGAFYMGFVLGGRRSGGGKPGLGSFIATRPMSPTLLACAILKTGVLTILISWLLLALVFVVSGQASGFPNMIEKLFGPELDQIRVVIASLSACLLVFGATWAALSIATSAALSGRPAIIGSMACLPFALFILAIVDQMIWRHNHPVQVDRLGVALCWILGVGLLAGASWFLLKARRRRLISVGAMVLSIGIWLLTIVSCFLIAWMCGALGTEDLPSHTLILWAGLSALPAIPMPLAPLALNWSWHR